MSSCNKVTQHFPSINHPVLSNEKGAAITDGRTADVKVRLSGESHRIKCMEEPIGQKSD
jgi:hypothetical protein